MGRLSGLLRRGIAGERPPAIVATLLLLAAWYGTNLVYDVLNHGPSRLFLRTALDEALPVVPVFVIPYVSLYAFVGVSMVLFLLFRVRVFRSAAVAMILAWAVSYAFYIALQSYVDRPSLAGSDVFTRMIRDVYAGDQPYNDFPSLHTSISTILAVHWWRVDRRIGIPVAVWVTLIVLSTVLVKQHYLADVAGGLALAAAASAIAIRLLDPRPVRSEDAAARPEGPGEHVGGEAPDGLAADRELVEGGPEDR